MESVITVVSGLPRSGTSMTMRMLEAGGMLLVVDNMRKPDEDNPRGYYEDERVKRIKKGDVFWLRDCLGKALKVISPLLEYLPSDNKYKVIFMMRDMEEILDSQRQMMKRLGQKVFDTSDIKMSKIFERHLRIIEEFLERQSNIDVLYVKYSDVIHNPYDQSNAVNRFLGNQLKVGEMIKVVEKSLYRQRKK